MNNKKKQHYVWRYYLRHWAIDEKIFCLRNGKIFNPNLTGVAAETYFYYSEELTDAEIAFIDKFAISIATSKNLQKIHRNWLKIHNSGFQLLHLLKLKGVDEKTLIEARTKIENNQYEEFHTFVESKAIFHLEELLKGKLTFFEDKSQKISFLTFLSVQYFRTNKIKAAVIEKGLKTINEKLGFDLEKLWPPLSHIFSMNISHALFAEKYKLYLLNNRTPTAFITGDQPVVNTFATHLEPDKPVQELELYYPISPQLAILITKDKNDWDDNVVSVKNDEVIQYNQHIFKNSKDSIYGNSRKLLDEYV